MAFGFDNVVFDIAKFDEIVFSDNHVFTDALAKATGKPFSDNPTFTDAQVQNVGKVFSDTFVIPSDAILFAVEKGWSETFTISDSIDLLPTWVRDFSESLTISDDLIKVVAKPLAEVMDISDAILKALTIASQIVGLKDIAHTLADPSIKADAWMPYIAIGSSNQAEDETNDTALWSEIHRKAGTVTVIRNTYYVKATFGQDEPTGDDQTIYEIGIFDNLVDGTLGRRWVVNTGISKDNIDEIIIECAVTILHGDTPGSSSQGLVEDFGMADSLAMHLTKTIPGLDDTFTIGGGVAPTYGLGSMVLGVDILGELKLQD